MSNYQQHQVELYNTTGGTPVGRMVSSTGFSILKSALLGSSPPLLLGNTAVSAWMEGKSRVNSNCENDVACTIPMVGLGRPIVACLAIQILDGNVEEGVLNFIRNLSQSIYYGTVNTLGKGYSTYIKDTSEWIHFSKIYDASKQAYRIEIFIKIPETLRDTCIPKDVATKAATLWVFAEQKPFYDLCQAYSSIPILLPTNMVDSQPISVYLPSMHALADEIFTLERNHQEIGRCEHDCVFLRGMLRYLRPIADETENAYQEWEQRAQSSPAKGKNFSMETVPEEEEDEKEKETLGPLFVDVGVQTKDNSYEMEQEDSRSELLRVMDKLWIERKEKKNLCEQFQAEKKEEEKNVYKLENEKKEEHLFRQNLQNKLDRIQLEEKQTCQENTDLRNKLEEVQKENTRMAKINQELKIKLESSFNWKSVAKSNDKRLKDSQTRFQEEKNSFERRIKELEEEIYISTCEKSGRKQEEEQSKDKIKPFEAFVQYVATTTRAVRMDYIPSVMGSLNQILFQLKEISGDDEAAMRVMKGEHIPESDLGLKWEDENLFTQKIREATVKKTLEGFQALEDIFNSHFNFLEYELKGGCYDSDDSGVEEDEKDYDELKWGGGDTSSFCEEDGEMVKYLSIMRDISASVQNAMQKSQQEDEKGKVHIKHDPWIKALFDRLICATVTFSVMLILQGNTSSPPNKELTKFFIEVLKSEDMSFESVQKSNVPISEEMSRILYITSSLSSNLSEVITTSFTGSIHEASNMVKKLGEKTYKEIYSCQNAMSSMNSMLQQTNDESISLSSTPPQEESEPTPPAPIPSRSTNHHTARRNKKRNKKRGKK